MKQTDTITITMTNDNAKSLVFNLASNGQNYYLIDCCQSFLGNLLFVFYWLYPIKAVKLTKKEFDILSRKQSEAKPKGRKGVKTTIATLAGLVIGRFLFPFISEISFTGIGLVLSLFLAILLVVVFRFWYNRKIRQKVQEELGLHMEKTKVRLKPVHLSSRYLTVYFILLAIVLLSSWFYWSSGDMMIWIVLLPILALYSLQSKIAFLPGEYHIR